jgi:hypothetical protein
MMERVLTRGAEWINRRLKQDDVRGLCTLVLVIYLALLGVSFVTAVRNQGQTAFGTILGADFPAFYVAGKIVNEYGTARLYDRALQARLYHELFPTEEPSALLPYLNAPFFILPFPLLARLPYAWAYLCWFLFSLGLYIAGFTLLWRALAELPQSAYRTGLIVALSFMPFLVECLAGGQTAAFGFFCLALAVVLERRGQAGLSGMALALLAYKPTLLILLGPMLLVTRQWRVLGGIIVGGLSLSVISWWVVGWPVTLEWFETLLGYSQHSTGAASGLRIFKYVDVNSFARALWGGAAALRWVTVGLILAVCLSLLVKAWWAQRGRDQSLNWALAIAWTPVLNLYLGIYDVTLVVVSALLLAAWLYQRGELDTEYKVHLLLLYVTPWISQTLAKVSGLQLYTIVLAAFGIYLLRRPPYLRRTNVKEKITQSI